MGLLGRQRPVLGGLPLVLLGLTLLAVTAGRTTLSNRASTRLSPVHGVRAVRNDQELQLALSASTRLSGHSCVAHGAELHAAKHMIISSARLLACITRGKPCGVGGGQRIT